MVTGVREEIPYSSRGTSTGKQNRAGSTSQPQFRSENTIAITGANQIFLALHQFASNSSSANFKNNSTRVSKLPEFFTTTTMFTIDGKSSKFELFENLFQTSLKIQNQLTEEDKIIYFHSLMHRDGLQTSKNIINPNR